MLEHIIRGYDEIPGLRWVENVNVPTGRWSGILVGGKITTIVHRMEHASTEYSVWGIHLATDDELTFLRKADSRPIIIKFVDCRLGLASRGTYLEVACRPDPSRRLVIPRGVAHLPTNVNGLVTVNTPKIFWDIGRRLVHPDLDVINVERDRGVTKFPAYRVCRFPVPSLMYPLALSAFKHRYDATYEAPFIFERNGNLYVLRRKHST